MDEAYERGFGRYWAKRPDVVRWSMAVLVLLLSQVVQMAPQLMAQWGSGYWVAVKRAWDSGFPVEVIVSGGIAFLVYLVSGSMVGLTRVWYGLNEAIYQTLFTSPCKWIGGDQLSVDDLYRQLVELNELRGFAFSFLIEAMQRFIERGFVLVEGSTKRYVDFLKQGIENCNKMVLATCVVRPYWFVTNPEARSVKGVVRRVGGWEVRGIHLVPFAEHKPRVRKMRLVILNEDQVMAMIRDLIANIIVPENGREHLECWRKQMYWEVPEVMWFVEDVSRCPEAVEVYWMLRQSLSSLEDSAHGVEDLMWFDRRAVLQFDFTDELLGKGELSLKWDKDVSVKSRIFGFYEKLLTKSPDSTTRYTSSDAWCSGQAIDVTVAEAEGNERQQLRVFRGFLSMLSELEMNLDTQLVSAGSLVGIVNVLLSGLTEGELMYTTNVKVRFRGDRPTVNVDWKANWDELEKLSAY